MGKTTRPSSGETPRARPRRKSKPRIKIAPRLRAEEGEDRLSKHWRTYFLAALVETSNVSASAARAGIAPSRAYKVRREDPNFAAEWHAALQEGYDHLEMETLAHLRQPDPARKIDVGGAIRLLTLHREEVAHQRALVDHRDEQEVLDSIDAMLDEMRERAAANAAILAADAPHEEAGDAGG